MLTKASFSMTRNIRKNIPLVTRVDENCWTIRGQLPFPQGLHFIYNQFAAKHVADIFSHPFFMEPEYWPDQPSPQFHLTEEMQSCMLVVKGMIHMKDVTTHLDNTMVLCRNPNDHTEFGIYNPSHVEEQTFEHVLKLIEGCGVEPQSRSAGENFSMSAAYGSGTGVDKQRMSSSPQLPGAGSVPGMGGGKGGRNIGNPGNLGNFGGSGPGSPIGRSGPPRMGTVKQVLESERKRKQQQFTSRRAAENEDDASPVGDENKQAHLDRMKKYGHMFDGKKRLDGMVEGDPRLYSDEPWRELSHRSPEDQLPDDVKEEIIKGELEKVQAGVSTVASSVEGLKERFRLSESDKELFDRFQKEQEEKQLRLKREREGAMKKGTLKWIVVPTRQTWQALEIWRSAFPGVQIYCSGNVPAYLTEEGKERGVTSPTAFSLPTAFTPHEPSPAPHEGTESSGVMMSAGGHGAKGGGGGSTTAAKASKQMASLMSSRNKQINNILNEEKENTQEEINDLGSNKVDPEYLSRKFNPVSKGQKRSGSVKDAAGKWHKPQIDLTRSKIEFFQKEGEERRRAQRNLENNNNNDNNEQHSSVANNNGGDDDVDANNNNTGVGSTLNTSMGADPSSIRRQRDYEKMKEMKIIKGQDEEKKRKETMMKDGSSTPVTTRRQTLSGLAQEMNSNTNNTSSSSSAESKSTSKTSSSSSSKINVAASDQEEILSAFSKSKSLLNAFKSKISTSAAAATKKDSSSLQAQKSGQQQQQHRPHYEITELDPEVFNTDAHEIPVDTIQVPKEENMISNNNNTDDGETTTTSSSPQKNNKPQNAYSYSTTHDEEEENPYELIANPTPLPGVKILPRDGAVVELFDGAFNLIRVTGDPHTNEFVMFHKDSGLIACTDLFHGSYTDYDPMNTWLVRVWGKFQRGGLYKDAGLLPAFRLNQLKSYPDGGLARIQRFVDDLTRGLAEKLKIMVYAHGTGPMILPEDLLSQQQRFEEKIREKNNNQQIRESTQLLESMMKQNADGSTGTKSSSSSSSSQEPKSDHNGGMYTKTFIADAIRAQYGLASLAEAYYMVENMNLQHPITLRDLAAAEEKWKSEHALAQAQERAKLMGTTPSSASPAVDDDASIAKKYAEEFERIKGGSSSFADDYRNQQHDGVVRHRPPPKEFNDQEHMDEDEVMRTKYVRPDKF